MIQLKNVTKTYKTRSGTIDAVKDVSLDIAKGEIYGIIGFSGAGKSTLVRLINMLERPSQGQVFVGGEELTALSRKKLLAARRSIGMIFQQFNLMMQRSALENIMLPLSIAGYKKQESKKRAHMLLERVGIPEKAAAYPSQLSGGQKQRVAIARALATEPKVLLCDEATSALDPSSTESILSLLSDINTDMGITIVLITHQLHVARSICSKTAIMENSRIVESGYTGQLFDYPKSQGAKKLLMASEDKPRAMLSIRAFAGSQEAAKDIIGEACTIEGIGLSVLYEGSGNVLFSLQSDEGSEEKLKSFLGQKSISFEEL
ncbi:MAG: ATP-binding cassette domain-containing protein [Eubacteriaceae bacterium]|nr:ATP-binding cassette domain-containing protein [Eubacteriaceae bacterium]